jgi:hypothetical protein
MVVVIMGLSKEITWPDIINACIGAMSLCVAILSFVVAYRVFRFQRRLTQETGELSCQIESFTEQESVRYRLTITFRNAGVAPITLERLGLAVTESIDVIPPKWEQNRPRLPARLGQGERSVAIYYSDEKELDPRHSRVVHAVAVTSSGREYQTSSVQVQKWQTLGTGFA